ncbi:hypothetical protein NPIL_227221 [Nephila pilipes]|uniref:Uncharacterized protein n=1 Tax=Nephila pilipes TaxID=299642 RepID=A0A8X6MTP9_NEPPI|nr:hypothetical protein NPIL_227221 [Nephila pilipes]
MLPTEIVICSSGVLIFKLVVILMLSSDCEIDKPRISKQNTIKGISTTPVYYKTQEDEHAVRADNRLAVFSESRTLLICGISFRMNSSVKSKASQNSTKTTNVTVSLSSVVETETTTKLSDNHRSRNHVILSLQTKHSFSTQ